VDHEELTEQVRACIELCGKGDPEAMYNVAKILLTKDFVKDR
jgi:hypothetical protein